MVSKPRGSGQKVIEISRFGLGSALDRIRSGRVGSGYPDPIRPAGYPDPIRPAKNKQTENDATREQPWFLSPLSEERTAVIVGSVMPSVCLTARDTC